MQFTKIENQGTPITVIEADDACYFYNGYFGLLAVAVRGTCDKLSIWVGNSNTEGSHLDNAECINMVKRYYSVLEPERQFLILSGEMDFAHWSLRITPVFDF